MPFRLLFLGMLLSIGQPSFAAAPVELQSWLKLDQQWTRDTDGPIVELGPKGAFDDTHIFAPATAKQDNEWMLWYSGSTADVANRVFQMGLATSPDGRLFTKHQNGPVYVFGDGRHSILTPVPLRAADGSILRENGKIRLWFTATWFAGGKGVHTLHETTSSDGINWAVPSAALMQGCYAPTIIKIGKLYQMWYTDVSGSPWIIRHAWSRDGRRWFTTPEPCLELDQDWEQDNLFYPHVIKVGDAYLMWYGSYWSNDGRRQNKTALGFAVSIDGFKWFKHENNPVFKPDENRPWESHYTTSHSVAFDPTTRSFRIWYASRKKPPFLNKYFAINTATWAKVPIIHTSQQTSTRPNAKTNPAAFADWQTETRQKVRSILGIPKQRIPLEPQPRGTIHHDGIRIEKWIFNSEQGSRIPALLYLPEKPASPELPAIVFTYGHGGSKSAWQYHYAGQLYAKLGLACLAFDPLGEEERHIKGRMGTRAHDPRSVHLRADNAGRLIMGKLVFDTMRAIDFLEQRDDIDPDRIGVAGNSLGGAKAGWMVATEPRIKFALVCGWAFENIGLRTKYCTKAPNQRVRELITWSDYLSLGAPHCATLVMNGSADWVIDREDDRSAWHGTDRATSSAVETYHALGADGRLATWYEPAAGHRPFFAYRAGIRWIHKQVGIPGMTMEKLNSLRTINSGHYCDKHGIRLERLYGTDLHQRGATLVDRNIRPLTREQLAVLKPEERGHPDFTVAGWLAQIEGKR